MYLLGIILEKKLLQGKMVPDYALFKDTRMTSRVSGLVISAYERERQRHKLLLFQSIPDIDMCVEYMSRYRVAISLGKKHGYKVLRCTMYGAMFLFPCDKQGKITGKALYIKRVPDGKWYEKSYDKAAAVLEEQETTVYKLSHDRRAQLLETSAVKPLLPQYYIGNKKNKPQQKEMIKEKKNAGKERKRIFRRKRTPDNTGKRI